MQKQLSYKIAKAFFSKPRWTFDELSLICGIGGREEAFQIFTAFVSEGLWHECEGGVFELTKAGTDAIAVAVSEYEKRKLETADKKEGHPKKDKKANAQPNGQCSCLDITDDEDTGRFSLEDDEGTQTDEVFSTTDMFSSLKERFLQGYQQENGQTMAFRVQDVNFGNHTVRAAKTETPLNVLVKMYRSTDAFKQLNPVDAIQLCTRPEAVIDLQETEFMVLQDNKQWLRLTILATLEKQGVLDETVLCKTSLVFVKGALT